MSLQKKVDIELSYEPDKVGDLAANTLDAYVLFGESWQSQGATVDQTQRLISWRTQWTGLYGIGGFGSLTYLPTIRWNAMSGQGETDSVQSAD